MNRAFGLTAIAVATTMALSVMPASASERPNHQGGHPMREAGGFDAITSGGPCADSSLWELAARSRALRVMISLRISNTEPGDRWRIRLHQNDRRIARGNRKARIDGSVQMRRPARNLPGVDEFVLIARNRTTGETCKGTLTY